MIDECPHPRPQAPAPTPRNATSCCTTPFPRYPHGGRPTHRTALDPTGASTSDPSPVPLSHPCPTQPPSPSTPHPPWPNLARQSSSTGIRPPAPSLKSSTPKTPKATTTSAHGARSTHTRICNHSRATNTNGHHTPLPQHHYQTPPQRI